LFLFEKLFDGVGEVLRRTKGRKLVSQSLYKNVIAFVKVVDKTRMPKNRPPMCAGGTKDLLGSTPSLNWLVLALGIGEGT
jgi:hypothetical protein